MIESRDGPPPTIADVARAAAVSTATVSRCLNTPDRVNARTRARVLNAVRRLGYTPNFGARALVARRTNTIGAVIPTMENAIFARGLQAFQETLHARGMTLLVASSLYRPEVEAEQIAALIARGAEGLLLIGHHRSAQTRRALDRRRTPAVVAWSYRPDAAHACVGFDNRAAMRALATAVLDRGHRELAVISAHQADNDRARDRVAGVCDAIEAAGPPARLAALIETPYGVETGAAAFESLMTRRPRPTAALCGNDVLAAGAIQAAKRLGLRVPEDVSITGFDDIEIATLVDPPIATVHVPHRAMGRRAAETLLTMIETGGSGERVALDADLRIRGSLGDAPTA